MKYTTVNSDIVRLQRWNIKEKGWVQESDLLKTTYRCTLLQAMHPELNGNNLCVVDGAGVEDLAAALKKEAPEGYTFSFATSSRKHSRFIYAKNNVIPRYFSRLSEEKQRSRPVSHGSIFTSWLRKILRFEEVRLIVLDDTKLANQINRGIGDCSGVISYPMAKALGHLSGMMQFRAGVRDRWIAKGTVLPLSGELLYKDKPVDLILPASSFKGNCPALGRVLSLKEMFFGYREVSTRTIAKLSHSVTGWFESEAAVSFLKEKVIERCTELAKVRNNLPKLVNLVTEAPLGLEEDWEAEARERFSYAWILKHDVQGKLRNHPKTARWANQSLRQLYLDAAAGGGIKAFSLMAAPHPTLPDNTIISTNLPTGNYVSFRYPVRYWGDVLQIQNFNPLDIGKIYLPTVVEFYKPFQLPDAIANEKVSYRQWELAQKMRGDRAKQKSLAYLFNKVINLGSALLQYLTPVIDDLFDFIYRNVLAYDAISILGYNGHYDGCFLINQVFYLKACAGDLDGK